MKLYTDLEKITGSFNALQVVTSVTASIGIGGFSAPAGLITPVSGVFNYYAFTTGTQAENLGDDGQASSFLKTMGWTIPW